MHRSSADAVSSSRDQVCEACVMCDDAKYACESLVYDCDPTSMSHVCTAVLGNACERVD